MKESKAADEMRTIRESMRFIRRFGIQKIVITPERAKKFMHSHVRRRAS
jgi:uncharacterized protein YPO0396